MSLAEMARKAMPLSSEIVIDAHAHVGPFASYYIAGNTPTGMVEGMDRIGVQSCWLFPFMLGCEWKRGNDDVLAAMKAFPERFWGLACMSLNYQDELIPELERCLEAGCAGVKLHSGWSRFDPDTVDMDNLLSYLNEYGLVCFSHNFGSPETIARYVKAYPRITFVAAHFSRHYAGVVNSCDNLFICACTPWGMGDLEAFVAEVGAERVLLATDFPCLDFATGLGPVLYANLPDQEKRLILGLNARKIMDRVNRNTRLWRESRDRAARKIVPETE